MILCSGALFFLVFAGLSLFAKDIMWELTRWQNEMRGVASERTDRWETMTTISGVVFAVMGLLALYAFFRGG